MKAISRFEIRREYQSLQEALGQVSEQFLKAEDPTLSVLNFIEDVSNVMGAVKRAYAADAKDRNAMASVVATAIKDLREACGTLEHAMAVVKDEPEDDNKKMPDADDA